MVYNHTAPGGQLGPTLSFRSLGHAGDYLLAPDLRQYMDYTGCGEPLNMPPPYVLQWPPKGTAGFAQPAVGGSTRFPSPPGDELAGRPWAEPRVRER